MVHRSCSFPNHVKLSCDKIHSWSDDRTLGGTNEMNVLVLYGSSRRHGNTEILTDRVVQNVDCTKIYLSDKKIHPIDDKRHDAEGFVFVDDDYDDIIQQVLNHDTLVFSTPVYWYGMSGQMKNFIDRWSQSL